MVRDPGKEAMQAKQRRQYYTLAGLLVVAGVLAVVRLLGDGPGTATAIESSSSIERQEGVDRSTDDREGEPGLEALARFEVTWPVEVQSDPFSLKRAFESIDEDVGKEPEGPEDKEEEPEEASLPDAAAIEREAQRSLRLGGILFDRPPRALINGRLWRQGDEIDGFRLKRIASDRIVVEKEDVEVKLKIGPSVNLHDQW